MQKHVAQRSIKAIKVRYQDCPRSKLLLFDLLPIAVERLIEIQVKKMAFSTVYYVCAKNLLKN